MCGSSTRRIISGTLLTRLCSIAAMSFLFISRVLGAKVGNFESLIILGKLCYVNKDI
jgi:hypothetical protein